MNTSELMPPPNGKIEFSLAKAKFSPKSAGCYILSTFDNFILYIGTTKDLSARIGQHLANPIKTNPTSLGRAHYFHSLCRDSESDAFKLERGWMNSHELIEGKLPILNSVRSPVS